MKLESYICPGCGRDVPIGPKGCPQCRPPKSRRKAVPKRSWEQDAAHDGLDLPDDEDFDYDDFLAREFGGKPHRKLGVKWYWWLLGLLLAAVWLWRAIGG